MKKQIIIMFIGAIIALASCKKSKKATPVSDLEGDWWLSKYYIDTARTGDINSAKLITNTNSSATTYQFNSNGTYIIGNSILNTFESFYWSLTDNNAYLKITDSTHQPGTSTLYPVLMLTPTNLELIDSVIISQQIYPTWMFYTKK